jgi:hypothetical protein
VSNQKPDPTLLRRPARHVKTGCSQCGGNFGAGNHGYSHCEDHADDTNWPSVSQVMRMAIPDGVLGGFHGPDRPGRYYAIEGGKVHGLTAYLDPDGDLRWMWDDMPDHTESLWTKEWRCQPAELLIRGVGDGITEILNALAALHLQPACTVQAVCSRLSAAFDAVAQAGIGPEVSAYFTLLAERRRQGWRPAQ